MEFFCQTQPQPGAAQSQVPSGQPEHCVCWWGYNGAPSASHIRSFFSHRGRRNMNSDRVYPTPAETLKDSTCKMRGWKQLILCFNTEFLEVWLVLKLFCLLPDTNFSPLEKCTEDLVLLSQAIIWSYFTNSCPFRSQRKLTKGKDASGKNNFKVLFYENFLL